MFQDLYRLIKRNKLLLPALFILFILYFSSIFAGFLSPYTYESADRSKSYHPPTPVYVTDDDGLAWPYIYEYKYHFTEASTRDYERVEGSRTPIEFFVSGDSYNFLGLLPTDRHLFGVDSDARIYLFGADSRGRDIFSRVLYGGRITLSIGIVGVSISLVIGLLVGGFSGYFGGWIDSAVQRIIEMIMMIPAFFLLLALRAAFPPDWSSIKVYFFIVIIMSLIGWAGMARVIRGMALSLREKDFVRAARALGSSDWKIIYNHIIPNTASYFIVAATVNVPGYILGEAGLSLLGLGIQDPHASWGTLLQEAMSVTQIRFHPWVLIPGVFIFLAIMSFNLVGDTLRDWFDPEQEIKQTV
jgi:peptide/nickel transport system permease protein